MFDRLGQFVSARWLPVLIVWIVTATVLIVVCPNLDEVTKDGEFGFLPENEPSRKAEKEFREAFPRDLLSSSIVLVVRRPERDGGLIDQLNPAAAAAGAITDTDFITLKLLPRLEQLARERGGLASEKADAGQNAEENGKKAKAARDGEAENGADADGPPPQKENDGNAEEIPIISRIRTIDAPRWKEVLTSDDQKAALVVIELTTEFLDHDNIELVADVNAILEGMRAENIVPAGLEIDISGAATVGRDMIVAQRESASATEAWTTILVVVLLILIYRAPLLALIPLITVAISVAIAQCILATMADAHIINFFSGIKTYIRVVLYGAGVDYCLFLIARYKEHLDRGEPTSEAVANALGNVGAALTASAGTVMCGIGMMVFAEFGKFQQAGIGITLSLVICLLAALTFTPALLRAVGRWAFWPHLPAESGSRAGGWVASENPFNRFLDRNWFQEIWRWAGQSLVKRPLTIWLASVALMLPFGIVGVVFHDTLSYGLLSELTDDAMSVEGARAVQEHFSPGMAAPVTVLLHSDDLTFSSFEGIDVVHELTEEIRRRGASLGVDDVRSISHPTGEDRSLRSMGTERPGVLSKALPYYVSETAKNNGHTTRLDVIFDRDPFSRESISQLNEFEILLKEVVDDVIPSVIAVEKILEKNVRAEYREGISIEYETTNFDVLSTAPTPRQLEGIRQTLEKVEGIGFIEALSTEEIEEIAEEIETAKADGETGIEPVTLMRVFAKPRYLIAPGAEADRIVDRDDDIKLIGATPSIRDLKAVTDRDQIRIDVLVLLGVFLILVILLRRPAVSLYLIVSVFFSYLVTLGMTFTVFWALDPVGFVGLDWKVPIFLFTILIAVGEDYNIFLMTRIEEEQRRVGIIPGIVEALERTGGIISSCGVIMAGTFASLMAGTLAGMQQLGFALAFGVLLDTFVVRPVLVPAYLIFINQHPTWGRYFGASTDAPQTELLTETRNNEQRDDDPPTNAS